MTDLNNLETIEIHGLRTIHKLCKFGADNNLEGFTFTEIVEHMFAELAKTHKVIKLLKDHECGQNVELINIKKEIMELLK